MSMHRFLEGHASEFMTKIVKTVPPALTVRELGVLFDKNDFNSFPVVENGRVIGLVTKLDFLKAFLFDTSHLVPHYNEIMERPVRDVMRKDVINITPETPLTHVLDLMVKLRTRGLPVVDSNGVLQGLISRTDLMRALSASTNK